jgi:ribosomal protein S18 acetylase RimI-like enzyme
LFALKLFAKFRPAFVCTYLPELMKPNSDPVVRRARAKDAALLAELGARTFSETFAADNTPEDMTAYLASSFGQELQAAELADPHSLFLIAEIDGVAGGYAKLGHGPTPESVIGNKPIELVRLYVSREWLGRSIGAALMRACIDEAAQKGYRTIWLGVWEHNQRARAFYRKCNFHEVGEHVFQLGNDSQTDILMQRFLDQEKESSLMLRSGSQRGSSVLNRLLDWLERHLKK